MNTLVIGQGQSVSTKTLKSGAVKAYILTRQEWAKANGLKPNGAEARKGYFAFRHQESANLGAIIAGTVQAKGLIPVSATPTKNGGLNVQYRAEGEVKVKASRKDEELEALRAMCAAHGMSIEDAIRAFRNSHREVAVKVA